MIGNVHIASFLHLPDYYSYVLAVPSEIGAPIVKDLSMVT